MGGNSSKKSGKSNTKSKPNSREIVKYKEIFKMFDRDNDGKITREELGLVMRKLGQDLPQNVLEQMISEVDLDESGTVEIEEFVILMIHHIEQPNADEEEIRQMFQVFDIHGNGTISSDELKQIMSTLGDDITEEEINNMMREADTDGDGLICYEEFKVMVKKLTG